MKAPIQPDVLNLSLHCLDTWMKGVKGVSEDWQIVRSELVYLQEQNALPKGDGQWHDLMAAWLASGLSSMIPNLDPLWPNPKWNQDQAMVAHALYTGAEWKAVVLDGLVIAHIYREEHETDPRKALMDLVTWETQVALDPVVSMDAVNLIERGKQNVLASKPDDSQAMLRMKKMVATGKLDRCECLALMDELMDVIAPARQK